MDTHPRRPPVARAKRAMAGVPLLVGDAPAIVRKTCSSSLGLFACLSVCPSALLIPMFRPQTLHAPFHDVPRLVSLRHHISTFAGSLTNPQRHDLG